MNPDLRLPPFIFLQAGPVGPGIASFLTDTIFEGVITNALLWFSSLSGTSTITVELDGTPFIAQTLAGVPPGYVASESATGLWLPVIGGKVIRADFSGGPTDLFSIWVTGYTGFDFQ